MKNNEVHTEMVQSVLHTTEQQREPILHARLGKIIAINPSLDSVRVDFEGNPYSTPVSAKVGRNFRLSELEMAIDGGFTCRVEFLNGDVSLPIVTDIFFSILEDDKPVSIRAKKLLIEADQELVLKSGATETVYRARGAKVTTRAKYVTSQAEKSNKIQGATIAIN
ncbi:hypothetical protein L4C34_14245 [Vibrio profundum]|uniref:hypothetical protein n=1 Tax=Vibrio profundum TaxID=2910247 RepID=UPI003D0B339D